MAIEQRKLEDLLIDLIRGIEDHSYECCSGGISWFDAHDYLETEKASRPCPECGKPALFELSDFRCHTEDCPVCYIGYRTGF